MPYRFDDEKLNKLAFEEEEMKRLDCMESVFFTDEYKNYLLNILDHVNLDNYGINDALYQPSFRITQPEWTDALGKMFSKINNIRVSSSISIGKFMMNYTLYDLRGSSENYKSWKHIDDLLQTRGTIDTTCNQEKYYFEYLDKVWIASLDETSKWICLVYDVTYIY